MKSKIIEEIHSMGKTNKISKLVYAQSLEYVEKYYDKIAPIIQGMNMFDTMYEVYMASWKFHNSSVPKKPKKEVITKAEYDLVANMDFGLCMQDLIILELKKYVDLNMISSELSKKVQKFVKKNYDMIEYDAEEMSVTEATKYAISVASKF